MLSIADLPGASRNPILAFAASPESESARCLAALVETTQALNQSLGFYDVLETVLNRMMVVSHMGYAVMVLFNETNEMQYIGGYDSARQPLDEQALIIPPSLLRRLMDCSEMVDVPAVSSHLLFCKDPAFINQNLQAAIAVPIFQANHLTGAVILVDMVARASFGDTGLSVLRAMAAQLSLVIDHALLTSEVETLNDSLEGRVQERTDQLAEANRWLADRLQAAERAVSEEMDIAKQRTRMFSTLVHELRAPMQLIIGHAWLAKSDSMASLNTSQRASLDVVLDASKYVQELATKILDVNKLEEGMLSIDPVAFDMRQLVLDTLEMSRGLVKDKSVRLMHNIPENLPYVLADPLRVRQILVNLLANACRFTDNGKITVSVADYKGSVIIAVADTGIGIPEDKVNTIFDFYTQVENSRSHSGTGLGLTISKQLVELHGGRMWVKSTLNVGTVFFFSLPVAAL